MGTMGFNCWRILNFRHVQSSLDWYRAIQSNHLRSEWMLEVHRPRRAKFDGDPLSGIHPHDKAEDDTVLTWLDLRPFVTAKLIRYDRRRVRSGEALLTNLSPSIRLGLTLLQSPQKRSPHFLIPIFIDRRRQWNGGEGKNQNSAHNRTRTTAGQRERSRPRSRLGDLAISSFSINS